VPPRRTILIGLSLLAAAGLRADQPLQLDRKRCVLEVEVHAVFETIALRLERFDADIVVDREAGRIVSAELIFDLADLHSGIARRDRDMLEWEEYSLFPRVRFRLGALERPASGALLARGTLTLHGVEHALSMPVSVLAEGEMYVVAGEAQLDYRDFGLPLLRKFLLQRVDPRLRVRFHLQGRAPE